MVVRASANSTRPLNSSILLASGSSAPNLNVNAQTQQPTNQPKDPRANVPNMLDCPVTSSGLLHTSSLRNTLFVQTVLALAFIFKRKTPKSTLLPAEAPPKHLHAKPPKKAGLQDSVVNFRGANGATLAVSGKAWGQRLWVEVVGRRHGLVKQNNDA